MQAVACYADGCNDQPQFGRAAEPCTSPASRSPPNLHNPLCPPLQGTTNPEVPSFCGYFGWTECPVHSTCTCNWNLFGLLCLSWGCDAGAQ